MEGDFLGFGAFVQVIIDAALGDARKDVVVHLTDLIAIALFKMKEKFNDVLTDLTFDGATTSHSLGEVGSIYMFLCQILRVWFSGG